MKSNAKQLTLKGLQKDVILRAIVSMGGVGAIVPTDFESVGASTHGFW